MNIDAHIVSSLHAVASSTPVTSGITVFFASWVPFIVVGAFAVYLLYKKPYTGLQNAVPFLWAMVAAFIARFLIASPIRYFIPRDRPFLTLTIDPLFTIHAPSFPSGHASFLFGFCTVAYAYNKKLGIALFILSTFVCLARIAAAVHYPSDIIVGMAVGVLSGLVTLKFLRPLSRR